MISFETDIPDKELLELMELGNEMGFDPLASMESEEYFLKLLEKYAPLGEEKMQAVRKEIEKDFLTFDKPPQWIQGSEWPFFNGKPMYFVGQLDTADNKKAMPCGLCFYVFWDKETGTIETIAQCD